MGRAAGTDAGALAPLLDAPGHPVEPAAVAARLEALLGSGRGAVPVAEGGAALGTLAPHRGAMPRQAAPFARVGPLVVAEAARGRGAGAPLVRKAAQCRS